jgi:hypothetical protein
MTDAFSAMGYPHWLIVAGAVLLVLGFIGLALRQGLEVNYESTEPAPTQANRKGEACGAGKGQMGHRSKTTSGRPRRSATIFALAQNN